MVDQPPTPKPAKTSLANWGVIALVLIGGIIYLVHGHKSAPIAATSSTSAHAPAAILEAGNVDGRVAPNWTLQDPNGKPVSLSQFAGHPVVMDFWATWCVPCQTELPWWRQFQSEYGSQGLVIVGVSEDQNLNDVRKYLASNRMSFQIVWDNGNGNENLQSSYGTPFGLPTTLFIDRQGKIAERVVGLEGKPDLDKEIHAIL